MEHDNGGGDESADNAGGMGDHDWAGQLPAHDDAEFDTKMGPVWDKLGRPKSAKEYKFTDKFEGFELDDTDKSYRDAMGGVFHRIGLTQRQVAELEKAQVAQIKVA